MKAVFKREFYGCLRSAQGICIMTIYLLLSGLLFTVYNISYSYPNVEVVYSFIALPLTALVAVMGFTAFTVETKKGTDIFLSMLPISTSDVLVGKYLARLAFFMIPTAVTVIYPVILDSMGEVGYVGCYSMLFALCLYQAFVLALGMAVSSFCKKTLTSGVISISVLAVTFILPYVPIWLSGVASDEWLSVLTIGVAFLCPYSQFDYFSIGIFDLRKIVWFVSFTAALLFCAWLGLKRRSQTR